jgi:hypothetical protein
VTTDRKWLQGPHLRGAPVAPHGGPQRMRKRLQRRRAVALPLLEPFHPLSHSSRRERVAAPRTSPPCPCRRAERRLSTSGAKWLQRRRRRSRAKWLQCPAPALRLAPPQGSTVLYFSAGGGAGTFSILKIFFNIQYIEYSIFAEKHCWRTRAGGRGAGTAAHSRRLQSRTRSGDGRKVPRGRWAVGATVGGYGKGGRPRCCSPSPYLRPKASRRRRAGHRQA